MIKKFLFWFLALTFSSVWAGNFYGTFGTGATARDTVTVYLTTLDTLGQSINADSVWIKRFYRTTLIDSTILTGAGTRTGFYVQSYAAEAGAGTDSLGEWGLELRWKVQGKYFNKEGFYFVVDGVLPGTNDNIGLNWGDVGSQGTTVILSGTTVGTASNLTGTANANVTTWLGSAPNVLRSGGVDIANQDTVRVDFDNSFGTLSDAQVDDITVGSVTADVGITQAGADKGWSTTTRQLTALDEDITTLDLNATTIGTVTTVTDLADSAIDSSSFKGNALTASKIGASAIGVSEAPNLDATVSSRMATYTQPTGFLAATFPTGTIANTTNITAGTVTTATNLTTNNDKTGYALSGAGNQALTDTLHRQAFAYQFPNLIANYSFEMDGSLTATVPTHWTVLNGEDYGTRTAAAFTGRYGGYIQTDSSGDSTKIRSKDFALPTNVFLYYGGYFVCANSNSIAYMKIKNSAGTTVDSINLNIGDAFTPMVKYFKVTTADSYYVILSNKASVSITDRYLDFDNLFAQISFDTIGALASGATDWNATERENIRKALGVDGTKTAGGTKGDVQKTLDTTDAIYARTDVATSTRLAPSTAGRTLDVSANGAIDTVLNVNKTDTSGLATLAAGQFTKVGDSTWLRAFDVSTSGNYADSASGWGATAAGGGSDTGSIKAMMTNNRFARHRTSPGNPNDTVNAVTTVVGTGSQSYDIWVRDTCNSLDITGAKVSVFNKSGALLDFKYTPASGKVTFAGNTNDTVVVYEVLPGYSFSIPDTVIISGNFKDTLNGCAFSPGTPVLGNLQTRVYAYVYTSSGIPIQNASLKAELLNKNDEIIVYNDTTDTTSVNVILSRMTVSAKSDQNGYVFIDLYRPRAMFPDRDYKYTFKIEAGGQVIWSEERLIPNVASHRLK